MSSSESSFMAAYPPRKIWILGAGHFGYIAAQRLSRRLPESHFLVVELREDRLQRVHEELGLPTHVEDCLEFLCGRPLPDDVWVVPAVPVHVAFRWILHQLSAIGEVQPLPVPEAADAQVPNPYRMSTGTLYASYATWICPDACNEPDDVCTHTGEPRPGDLFEHLSRIQIPGFQVTVFRSRQLAPGVGGYPGGYLKDVLARQVAEQPGSYLIATSCRCHGVVDALQWKR